MDFADLIPNGLRSTQTINSINTRGEASQKVVNRNKQWPRRLTGNDEHYNSNEIHVKSAINDKSLQWTAMGTRDVCPTSTRSARTKGNNASNSDKVIELEPPINGVHDRRERGGGENTTH